MFLKFLLNIKRALWFKLILWYSSIFILSSVSFYILTYYFISFTLLKLSHDAILSEISDIKAGYASVGMAFLKKEMEFMRQSPKKQTFFIRIADGRNNTIQVLYSHLWVEFDIKKLEGIEPDETEWIRLPSGNKAYFLEVNTSLLHDGNWLQLGLSTEDHTKILNQFREMFAGVTIIIVLLGFISGILLALRALRPIGHLIKTVQSITLGRMGTRVPRTGAGDELDILARLFNEMLEKIEILFGAMKGSLDNVAHDLRTPMTRLRNKAETILHAQVDKEGEMGAFAEGVVEESERMLRMLNTLMDISEAETGIMHLNKKEINIKVLLEDVADLYHYVAEENNLSLNMKIADNLRAVVDPDRMGQAVANLLDNAIKYTPAGGRIALEAFRQNQKIVIHIKDTGMGIPDEALPRIWDRLYRVDASRSKAGLGLGLTQVKAIIKAHDGRIEVASELGKGSIFTILLPT